MQSTLTTDDLRPRTDEEMDAYLAKLGLAPKVEPAEKAIEVTTRPDFDNLQQLEGLDAYNLDVNGTTFRFTWAQLQSWSALRAEMRRRHPDVIITWEPDPPQKLRVMRGRDKYGASLGEKFVNKAGEWDRIIGDLYANREVIPQDSQADPRGRAIVALRAALRGAPTVPAQPLLWKDQRRRGAHDMRQADTLRYVISTDAAMALMEREGIGVSRAEVADILRGRFHATSGPVRVQGRLVRAYAVSAGAVERAR